MIFIFIKGESIWIIDPSGTASHMIAGTFFRMLDPDELEAVEIMRKAYNGMRADEAVENILNMFVHTKDNQELVARVRRQKYV